jgi:DNA excision repair protein ERCC-1
MAVNPYSKKKSSSPSSSSTTTNNTTAATSRIPDKEKSNVVHHSGLPPQPQNNNRQHEDKILFGTHNHNDHDHHHHHHDSLSLKRSYATFSQAFGGPEDITSNSSNKDDLLSSSISATTTTTTLPLLSHQQPQRQPPSTSSTATIVTTTTKSSSSSSSSWTDRDCHTLLQQPHVLYVSTKQRGNPVLQYIRNVPIVYTTMIPDYIMSSTRCALFLSCKYHSLYPQYIYRRIHELRTDFTLRVLLVLVDLEDNANILLFLNRLAVQHNLSLVLSWSEVEAARYLETYKALDGKDASLILQQKKDSIHYTDQVVDFFTASSRSGGGTAVNKTDAIQLLSNFTSIRAITAASIEEIGLVPGMGPVKCQRLYDALHKPFVSGKYKHQFHKKQEQHQINEVTVANEEETTQQPSPQPQYKDEISTDNTVILQNTTVTNEKQ